MLIFSLGRFVGDPSFIKFSKEQFEEFKDDKLELNSEQRFSIFKGITSSGNEVDFEQLLKIFRESPSKEIKNDALFCLGYFHQRNILEKILKLLMESDEIKPQDIDTVLAGFSSHKDGIELIWNWLQEEWDTIIKKVSEGSDTHIDIIRTCLSRLATGKHKKEVKKFFEEKNLKILNNTVES